MLTYSVLACAVLCATAQDLFLGTRVGGSGTMSSAEGWETLQVDSTRSLQLGWAGHPDGVHIRLRQDGQPDGWLALGFGDHDDFLVGIPARDGSMCLAHVDSDVVQETPAHFSSASFQKITLDSKPVGVAIDVVLRWGVGAITNGTTAATLTTVRYVMGDTGSFSTPESCGVPITVPTKALANSHKVKVSVDVSYQRRSEYRNLLSPRLRCNGGCGHSECCNLYDSTCCHSKCKKCGPHYVVGQIKHAVCC